MRGQYAYCLRSVTVMSRSSSVILFNLQPLRPIPLANRDQMDLAGSPSEPLATLQHQLFLVRFAQLPDESTVLDPIEAVIQTNIGNFRANAIIRNIVN